jgi:uncharacterized protein (TIGR02284 family)
VTVFTFDLFGEGETSEGCWAIQHLNSQRERGIMSVDKSVTDDVLQVLADGQNGYTKAAEKLADSASPELESVFRRYADQRGQFAAELEEMAEDYGDHIEASGSVAAAIHRSWMSLKDMASGSDPAGVLKAAVSGEEHAVEVYQEALKEDVSTRLRSVLERQNRDVAAAKRHLETLTASLAKV